VTQRINESGGDPFRLGVAAGVNDVYVFLAGAADCQDGLEVDAPYREAANWARRQPIRQTLNDPLFARAQKEPAFETVRRELVRVCQAYLDDRQYIALGEALLEYCWPAIGLAYELAERWELKQTSPEYVVGSAYARLALLQHVFAPVVEAYNSAFARAAREIGPEPA